MVEDAEEFCAIMVETAKSANVSATSGEYVATDFHKRKLRAMQIIRRRCSHGRSVAVLAVFRPTKAFRYGINLESSDFRTDSNVRHSR